GIVPEPGKKGVVTVGALARLYAAKRNAVRAASKSVKDIMVANATSIVGVIGMAPRYEDCGLFGYVHNTDLGEEKQFSAFCAVIGRKRSARKLLVVFRGTDTSFVGWKEDLNMTLVNSVPSQKEAVSYLEKAARRFSYPIILAGHSKGGNLAIYASAFCGDSVQRRIAAIYSNDAPGFHGDVIQSKGYNEICERIRAFVPQSSFVGMLLEHGRPPLVVKSNASGFIQHDICTWEVTHDNLFVGGDLTSMSRLVNKIIREWIGKLGTAQRHKFIDALYRILVSTNAHSFSGLGSDWLHAAVSIIGGLKNIDGPTKKLMGEILGELFRTAKKNILLEAQEKRRGR
ncbi:MAG: DUF2974 domain-containing protein, partial [Treponema sp.]|nr:DUF2974 domain-containing protein [Treponema sp.]